MLLAGGTSRDSGIGIGRRVNDYCTYMCVICGFVYDEAKGDPDSGIAPGTRWDDIPVGWTCPDCGAAKEEFEMIPI